MDYGSFGAGRAPYSLSQILPYGKFVKRAGPASRRSFDRDTPAKLKRPPLRPTGS